MSSIREFKLPDLGEGLTESELVAWHVAVGDSVELNQPIAEVESAKAIVQLPSPFAGTVSQLFGEPGATLAVGTVIAAFEVEDATQPSDEMRPAGETAAPARNAVLVGYGPPVEGGSRPQRRKRDGHAEPVVQREPATEAVAVIAAERPRSTPPVRRLAQELGVDLETLQGSGDGGLITRDDVTGAAPVAPVAGSGATERPVLPGEIRARETRRPIAGIRKRTAEAMVSSAFTAPHVTEFLTVDVTPTVELLARLAESREFRGHRLTMLTVVAKAVCIAIGRNPSLNSRWDAAAGEIVEFGYVNLGIAVATPRGLMVPNIPDAEALSLLELADALGALAETARAGAATPEQLSGGTISISNVGVFGVDAGTPILNPGEAAILATGAIRRMPWEHRGEIALREVMTLSLSFDHRLVDGEQGSRFLTDVGRILAEPGSVLAMV